MIGAGRDDLVEGAGWEEFVFEGECADAAAQRNTISDFDCGLAVAVFADEDADVVVVEESASVDGRVRCRAAGESEFFTSLDAAGEWQQSRALVSLERQVYSAQACHGRAVQARSNPDLEFARVGPGRLDVDSRAA